MKNKEDDLNEQSATCKNTVAELSQQTNIIITMVGYPKDVENVYFGKEGILENAKENSYLVDMTTYKPSLAKKIFEEGAKRNLYAIDAPVSGGDVGDRKSVV